MPDIVELPVDELHAVVIGFLEPVWLQDAADVLVAAEATVRLVWEDVPSFSAHS